MFVNLLHLEDIFTFSKQFEPNSAKHTDKTIWNGSCGWQQKRQTQYIVVNTRGQEPQLLPSLFPEKSIKLERTSGSRL